MGFLLQITMSCPCAISRQVAGAGAGCRCCELAVHVVGTGCWRRCWCWVPGAGAVSWLCTWWRQVAGVGAGAGCRCWCWCRCCELAVHVVETGCWCRCWCWCCELAVHVVGTGCWWWCGVPVLVLGSGAGAGAVSWLYVVEKVGGAGAGCRCWWAPGAGAGAVSWLCTCIDTLQVLVWPTAVSRAVLFARILLYV